MIVFIDSGVLGLLANPNNLDEAVECENWLYTMLSRGINVYSSDLCDYEVRRSLVLASQKKSSLNGIPKLNGLREIIFFLPITYPLLIKASSLWAQARSKGIPTANDSSLDVDIIICCHWQMLQEESPGRYAVIATTNVKHLSRFAEAQLWRNII
jgi:hypothetical protein